MARITFVGAGSTVFARNLLQDLFTFPELRESEIVLFDIDPGRLADTEAVATRLAAEAGARPAISATTDRRRALDGADYAINMIQVGGYRPATVTDFEIPTRFGLRQTIADTLGIGGIMRALRTIPVMRGIAADMEAGCPGALLLNYTNPMAMLCIAMDRVSPVRTVGLCHSVQGTAADLAEWLGVPANEVDYLCAGINHVAFYLRFERDGQDLYPALRDLAARGDFPAWERVRFEVFRRFGFFVTESSEHFSEYVPWFIKRDRPDLIDRFNIPLDEYPARCEDQIADWADQRAALTSGDPGALDAYRAARAGRLHGMDERRLRFVEKESREQAAAMRARMLAGGGHGHADPDTGHSGEYGTLIIHSMETGQPRVVYGNVPNRAIIDNLPDGCCVEVPCLVDRNGVQPTRIGALPPQLAALMRSNIGVQEVTVDAALTGSRERVVQAALLDPHTAAELDPEQIAALVDALLAAHGELIPPMA
ncbi:MAG: alpha-glucosidase/alpha-galactosidase [Chloroflexota bacterium]